MRSRSLALDTRPSMIRCFSLCVQTYFPATLLSEDAMTHIHFPCFSCAALRTADPLFIHLTPICPQRDSVMFPSRKSLFTSHNSRNVVLKFLSSFCHGAYIIECSISHTRLSNLRAETPTVYVSNRVCAH